MAVWFLPLIFIGFAFPLPPFVFSTIDPTFMEKLSNLQKEGVSRDQIQKWWEVTYRRRNARVFPICITKNSKGVYPHSLSKWGPILDDIAKQDWRKFEYSKFIFSSSNSDLKKISKTVMYVTDTVDSLYFHQFDQFLHIHIDLNPTYKAVGFLAQAITGPLAVPGGLFDNDLYCHRTSSSNVKLDNLQKDVPNWTKVTFVEPCSFAPRSNYKWPNVYVMDGTRVTPPLKTSQFSFRYRWTEAQCLETGFVQFIYIFTSTFKADDYQIKLTPVWHFGSVQTGLSTQYYGGFVGKEGYHCNQPTASGYIKEVDSIRLIPDPKYDYCVTKGEGRDDHNTCPPDPFTCDNLWTSNYQWTENVKGWLSSLKTKNNWHWKECCELGTLPPDPTTTTTTTTSTTTTTTTITTTTTTTPTTTTTTTPTTTTTTTPPPPATKPPPLTTTLKSEEIVELELASKSKEAEKASQVTHGDFCILIWLVVIPLSDHIARYYKDFPDYKKIGLGFWIISHVTLHVGSVVMIWYSFGLVVGTGDNKLGNVSGLHLGLGMFTTVLQHLGFLTALQQLEDLTVSEAFKFVATHSLFGKAAYVFGILSVVLSNANGVKRFASIGLVLIRVVGVAVTVYVEWKQDQVIGLVAHRARCPVLQRILMEGRAKPPMMKIKILVLGTLSIVLLSYFLCMKVYFRV
ncbi:unnamed protein product [Orchesella dallaii]|uniref:Cytochrome b561 domain-containing protein n=1 Tax=Orchesella dallaii TaxID=48710 RepID=A0ABP1RJM9_9HEXA